MIRPLPSCAALLLLLCCSALRADDWPQWFGPQRDGVYRESGIPDRFPPEGLKVIWRAPVAGGYSGPAVSDHRVYVTDFVAGSATGRPRNPFDRTTQAGVERIQCFDESTGRLLWSDSYEVGYTMSYSAGPRATPAVDADHVYTLGGEGDLRCADRISGKLVWSKRFPNDQNPTPMWGFDSHPLVDGDKVVCLTGGSDPQHGRGVITAFDTRTGDVAWSALAAKEPGYSSPIIVTSGGVRQLIAWDPISINGLDPQTGKIYWSIPFGPAKMGMTIATPRFHHDPELGDLLLFSTQYDGSTLVKLEGNPPTASVVWKRAGKNDRKTDAIHAVFSPPVLRDGHIYGVDSYGQLRCLDLKTGDRIWSTSDATTYDAGEQKWATAFLFPLGDSGERYLLANEHGDLILATLNPQGYHKISRTHLLDPTNHDPGRPVLWSCPALANGRIFWRNDRELVCASLLGR